MLIEEIVIWKIKDHFSPKQIIHLIYFSLIFSKNNMNLEYVFYDPQCKEYQKSNKDIEKYIANLNLPTAKTYAALALTNKKI